MSKLVLVALTLPIGLLAACQKASPEYLEILYPIMSLSAASSEFGEIEWLGTSERTIMLANDGDMPMGVGSIVVGDEDDGTAFSVRWNTAAIECPEVSTDTGATAKGIDVDTGSTEPGDDTGGTDTGGGGEVLAGALFVLDPGCQIPLNVTYSATAQGDSYDALVIESAGTELTAEEEAAGEDLPAYLADPVHTKQVVYLHGETSFEQGSVVVRPRSFDFGFVHPDQAADEEPARIQISNVGDGDVTITSAELSSSCDEAYTLENLFDAGRVLEGGQNTLAEVTFTPSDTNASYCQLYVYTDSEANPRIDVTLTGNTGTDPENVPPTVYIRSPQNGYHFASTRALEIELNIFDLNQPATSLICRVKSAVLQNVTLADCAATDESGHVFVSIDPDDLDAGSDTLLVTVTDGMETSAYASVSVVINSDYPADDDDGDGYGVDGDADGLNFDCDDENIYTYPMAAEIYDGEDNDCDGEIDEGTIGYDDDGDGVSEIDGDCNDYNDDVQPGAPERGDGLDNDCDGIADEGTSLHDDDGDGYAEVNNDCDDNDASVNPGATEICDGVDNDCDGLRDSADGCVATSSEPLIVGNVIRMAQSACLEAEVVTMDVLVFDADNDVITYAWSSEGDGTFDNPSAAVVNYTAPAIAGDTKNSGRNENIYAVIQDDDGQDWAFGRIAVWDDNTDLYEPYTQVIIQEDAGGCSSTGGNPAGALVVAGAALAMAFRRRD